MKSKSNTIQVFLSYARNDNTLAIALAEELQKRGFKVWDEQSILLEEDITNQLSKALEESDSMIALLNQHSYSSSYVRSEIEHAFFDDRYKNRLLPVLISSSSEDDFARLPWILTKLQFLKLSEDLPINKMVKKITDKFISLIESGGS